MNLPTLRTLCPICSSPADPVLADAEVFVKRVSAKKVGAELKVFHCNLASHIFFVRTEDLARAIPRPARNTTNQAIPSV